MKNIVIKSILILALLFSFNNSYSQIGLQFNYIKPSGAMAYYFKPTFGMEIFSKLDDEDDNFVFGASLGFYSLKTRLDTFKTYAIKVENGVPSIHPGYEIYYDYFVMELGINSEYKFLLSKFTPLVGLGINANLYSFNYKQEIETFISEDAVGEGSFYLAITPIVGVRYELNSNWVVSAGFGKNIGIISKAELFSYWKSFANISYNF